jgi:hypothetical protein
MRQPKSASLSGSATRLLTALLILLAAVSLALAQRSRTRFSGDVQTAREVGQHSNETPNWTNATGFKKDVFTFVRIKYSTHNRLRSNGYHFGSSRWAIDFPDADLNLAYRLQQMTSMKVNPDGRVLEISDPTLDNYPFIYIVEPGDLAFTDEELPILRRYLLNGGFLMFDDFWGEDEWENMAGEMKRVFPDRDWVDIPRTHPLFSCVFPIPPELSLQCPNVNLGTASQYHGITWEREDAREVHIRALYDDQGRMMCIATHNTDNGDGWEREGENEYYFREFSEKKSYPLGINIIFYAMTH